MFEIVNCFSIHRTLTFESHHALYGLARTHLVWLSQRKVKCGEVFSYLYVRGHHTSITLLTVLYSVWKYCRVFETRIWQIFCSSSPLCSSLLYAIPPSFLSHPPFPPSYTGFKESSYFPPRLPMIASSLVDPVQGSPAFSLAGQIWLRWHTLVNSCCGEYSELFATKWLLYAFPCSLSKFLCLPFSFCWWAERDEADRDISLCDDKFLIRGLVCSPNKSFW